MSGVFAYPLMAAHATRAASSSTWLRDWMAFLGQPGVAGVTCELREARFMESRSCVAYSIIPELVFRLLNLASVYLRG